MVGQAAAASPTDAHTAVRAARAAFDDQRWSGMPARERSRILLRAASLMREHTEELAQAESLDVGKPITFARNIDVPNAADHFEYYGALAQQLDGSVRNTPLPALAYTRREPHGVVAAISPYNFPLILSCSKIAPALAA
ncbi:aldehyde dehydrogenase family protein [Nesterenkonia pannonica]|uniref:aldehyde dehydrogenase family protein n=1 Tax=Nesterenkonia pannonica TaxID=1548602 RepID=UPI0021644EE8|nr:aldehyde dehydrogenase family protein [Nesterenkonia pannonica]